MTPELEAEIKKALFDLQKNNWKYYNLKALSLKFGVSESTIRRRADQYGITLPVGRPLKSAVAEVKEETPVKVVEEPKEVKEKVDNDVIFENLEVKSLETLSTYISAQVLSVRLDPTVKKSGVNFTIYDTPCERLKDSFDYEKDIKEFFEKHCIGKAISLLKLYVNDGKAYNFTVMTLLGQYCSNNNINLTIYSGVKEIKALKDLTPVPINKNFEKIGQGLGIDRYLYKVTWDDIKDLETIFFTYVTYKGASHMFITNSYDKALECFVRIEKTLNNEVKHQSSIQKVNNGNVFTFLTTV